MEERHESEGEECEDEGVCVGTKQDWIQCSQRTKIMPSLSLSRHIQNCIPKRTLAMRTRPRRTPYGTSLVSSWEGQKERPEDGPSHSGHDMARLQGKTGSQGMVPLQLTSRAK